VNVLICGDLWWFELIPVYVVSRESLQMSVYRLLSVE